MKRLNLKTVLYNETSARNFEPFKIAEYLKEIIPSALIELRKELFKPHDDLARELAGVRVRNISSISSYQPLYGEIEYEKRTLKDPERISAAVLYDGEGLQQIGRGLIPKEERNLDHLHIIFTRRLPAGFDENDKRYHARVVILGFPAIISLTGIVEAPAKPKKYYELRNKFLNLGFALIEEKLREEFRGAFIDYEDERLTQVMKGYALQAIFHHLFNQPFCPDKNCRLYNAHWQEEVINAQVRSARLCNRHNDMIIKYKDENLH